MAPIRFNSELQEGIFFNENILCFIHIPKTAGTSFAHLLKWMVGSSKYRRITLGMSEGTIAVDFNINDLRAISGHFHYEIYRILKKKAIMLTFLRDPISRSISQFHQFKRSGKDAPYFWKHVDEYELLKDISLQDYINHPHLGKALSNPQTRYLGAHLDSVENVEDLSMAGWRQDKNSENIFVSLDLAKERLEQIAFLGLQDRFHESLEVFSYQFGAAQISSFPELNKTDNGLQKAKLPESITDQLAQMNRMDIELYEYGKKIFNQRLEEINGEFLKTKQLNNNHTIQDWIRIENWPEKEKTRNLFFKFETLISMSGWHNTDYSSDGNSWTWSGPDVESVIDFPLDRSVDLRMNIAIHDTMAPDMVDNLRIEIDENPLMFSHLIKNKAHLITAIITANTLKPSYTYTTIKFIINRTIRPSEVNQASTDNRLLGFALQSIEFKESNNLYVAFIKSLKYHLYKLKEIFRGKIKIVL